ncbi:hypothetical protein Aeqsu_0299 [Aequorivita sublithincola DSM 14238]|uniref:DUF4760 domain-containing protein n=1 Tax=Aequorivita sublithincola (strain DSM 14238 / LMG 21431 / ACAM 643 / 9-3) TaxID=746697 RepID=I3YS45_AEQSU|nr:hypothetical protein [Aequorivita sublithincola]AFL79813.1 hypothetical protein Aeqsu_0299 [Aequorivita sublithincola DSM 14238]
MDLTQIKLVLEIVGIIVTILGVPVAIYVFLAEKKRERLDRENGTYSTLDDRYIEFLKICLDHSELNIYEMDQKKPKNFTDDQISQRKIIIEILICLFERAYLMYSDQEDAIKKRQWSGWNTYMQNWMENKQFRVLWINYFNTQYDSQFLAHMNKLYHNSQGGIS